MTHIVSYSNAPYQDLHEQFFRTHPDAVEFAERFGKSYRYIWLCELGEYQTGTGKWVRDWIYHWWSAAVTETDWGECPDAGWGRPESRKHLAPYRPVLFKGKRYAHLNVRASPTRVSVEAPSSRTEHLLNSVQQQQALVGGTGEGPSPANTRM